MIVVQQRLVILYFAWFSRFQFSYSLSIYRAHCKGFSFKSTHYWPISNFSYSLIN